MITSRREPGRQHGVSGLLGEIGEARGEGLMAAGYRHGIPEGRLIHTAATHS